MLAAMELISKATAIQELPLVLECVEESYLVKAIDTMVLVLASHSTEEADKLRKLKQIRGLIQLLNAFLKASFYTDAIMPQHSIEALKLGEKLQEIAVKEEDKLLIVRLASVILAAKPNVTIT